MEKSWSCEMNILLELSNLFYLHLGGFRRKTCWCSVVEVRLKGSGLRSQGVGVVVAREGPIKETIDGTETGAGAGARSSMGGRRPIAGLLDLAVLVKPCPGSWW